MVILPHVQVQTILVELKIKYRSPLSCGMTGRWLRHLLLRFWWIFNKFYPPHFSCKHLEQPAFFWLTINFHSTHIFLSTTTATELHKKDRIKTYSWFCLLSAHQPASKSSQVQKEICEAPAEKKGAEVLYVCSWVQYVLPFMKRFLKSANEPLS